MNFVDKKIISNFLYNTTYQLLVIILPIITTPFLARVLGVQAIGTNSYIQTISSFFVIFGILGINLYGSKEIASVRDDKENLSATFYTMYVIQVIAHILILILYFYLFVINTNDYNDLFFIQSIFILGSIFDVSWFMKGVEDFKRLTIRNFIIKMISIICIFTFIRSSEDLWIYILINALSTILGNIVMWRYIFEYVEFKGFSFVNFRYHLKNILLLFLPVLFYQIYTAGDRIILEKISGTKELGYYDQATKLIRISLTVVTSLNVVMLPRISNMYTKAKQRDIQGAIHQIITVTLLIGCFITALIAGASPSIVPWFFGLDYLEVIPLLMIMSLIIIINPVGSILTLQLGLASNNNKAFIIPYIIGAIVSLSSNFFLIPKFGALGASISIVLTELIVLIIRMFFATSKVQLKVVFNQTYKYLLSGVITCGVVFFLGEIINTDYIIINFFQGIIGILSYGFLLLLFKEKLLKSIINQVLKISNQSK
ncbi:hypothetical protein COE46_22615 [Bacillus cereus]|nr:hypothetical protein COE46_22615 [Bacillus cereus]